MRVMLTVASLGPYQRSACSRTCVLKDLRALGLRALGSTRALSSHAIEVRAIEGHRIVALLQ